MLMANPGAAVVGGGDVGTRPRKTCSKCAHGTTLPQMCELLPDLLDRQDAPDGAAVTLPFLWIVMCRSRMRIVAVKPMALDPFL
jgi:hypothetical protein